METTTKTGIEKVEDCYRSKNGIKKTDDPIPRDGQSDGQATAVESYIGSDRIRILILRCGEGGYSIGDGKLNFSCY